LNRQPEWWRYARAAGLTRISPFEATRRSSGKSFRAAIFPG
jgi:hypothetical protein